MTNIYGNISTMPWLFGRIARPEVEALMQKNGSVEGLFLVRESTRQPGSFVLSCIAQGTLQHYVIKNVSGQYQVDDGPLFVTLEDLVEHYHKPDDRLPTVLTKYCMNADAANPDNGNSYEGIWDAQNTVQAKVTKTTSLRSQSSNVSNVTSGMSNMSMNQGMPVPQSTGDANSRDFRTIDRVKKWIDREDAIGNVQVKKTETLKKKNLEGIGESGGEKSQALFDKFDRAATAEEQLYVQWVNNKLSASGKSIEDLGPSLKSGVIVIEVISKMCDLPPPTYSKRPRAVVQEADNWHVVIKYMRKLGIQVDPHPGEDEAFGLDPTQCHKGDRREMLKLFSRLMLYEAHNPR